MGPHRLRRADELQTDPEKKKEATAARATKKARGPHVHAASKKPEIHDEDAEDDELDPERWEVIDASQNSETIFDRVRARVQEALAE